MKAVSLGRKIISCVSKGLAGVRHTNVILKVLTALVWLCHNGRVQTLNGRGAPRHLGASQYPKE
jgi:hypothetical protein